MLNGAILFVSLTVFVSTLLVNLGLLIDPTLGSDTMEDALSTVLLITIFSMFICSTPNWKLVSLKKEPSWSKIIFEYAIPIYYLLVTIFVIFYHFTRTLELYHTCSRIVNLGQAKAPAVERL